MRTAHSLAVIVSAYCSDRGEYSCQSSWKDRASLINFLIIPLITEMNTLQSCHSSIWLKATSVGLVLSAPNNPI